MVGLQLDVSVFGIRFYFSLLEKVVGLQPLAQDREELWNFSLLEKVVGLQQDETDGALDPDFSLLEKVVGLQMAHAHLHTKLTDF